MRARGVSTFRLQTGYNSNGQIPSKMILLRSLLCTDVLF
jgi:hypothetical protein